LYQRDAKGYETEPAMKIQQPIKMSAVQVDRYYDYIARSGKKIGLDIDDRWAAAKKEIALKVSYFDNYVGTLNLVCNANQKKVLKTQKLHGDGKLKTVTFFIEDLKPNSLEHNFDFALQAGENTKSIVVSIVRGIRAENN
jgi:hypothetical protein